MAREILKRHFKIGDKVKLKDYSSYSDWEIHNGQEATVTDLKVMSEFNISVIWKDKSTSRVSESNLVHFPGEWDE